MWNARVGKADECDRSMFITTVDYERLVLKSAAEPLLSKMNNVAGYRLIRPKSVIEACLSQL